MERDTVITLARKSEGEEQQHGMWRMHVEDLERFAALVEERLKSQGYRQCAKGQRTTQFCGMLDEAVLAEREACADLCKYVYTEVLDDSEDIAKLCEGYIRSRE